MDELRSEVLAALTTAAGPLSTADVARALGLSPVGTEAYRALLGLYDRGAVDCAQRPRAGSRILYWHPTPQPRTSEENDRDPDR